MLPLRLARPGCRPLRTAIRVAVPVRLVSHTLPRRPPLPPATRRSRAFVAACVVAAAAFYLGNSQTVPVTGRRRFNYLSDRLVQLSFSRAADAVVRQVQDEGGHFLSDWDPRTRLVKRVMKRLIPVSGMADLDWDVHVIANSCMCPLSLPRACR